VGAAWLRETCGHCEFCRSGRENLCETASFNGYTADGGYAEYMALRRRSCIAYPRASRICTPRRSCAPES